jgi:hypothetical protein
VILLISHTEVETAISLVSDRDLIQTYSNNALSFSRQFSWDKTASAFDKIIRQLT